MTLNSEQELLATRDKLRMLEASYAVAAKDPQVGSHVQELELRSLKRLINQLKEEIARFETREPTAANQ